MDVSSFEEGELGALSQVLSLDGAEVSTKLTDGLLTVWISFAISGGRLEGSLTVSPGVEWDDLTIQFDGPLRDGVFEENLSGVTSIEHNAGRSTRDLKIRMRLEKQ